MSLVFALAASAQELPQVQQQSPTGMCFLVPGLCTEVPASGSAQFEIQKGKKERETDLFLLMRILKVA